MDEEDTMKEVQEEDLIHVVDLIQEEHTIQEEDLKEAEVDLIVAVVDFRGTEVDFKATEVDFKVTEEDLMVIEEEGVLLVAIIIAIIIQGAQTKDMKQIPSPQ